MIFDRLELPVPAYLLGLCFGTGRERKVGDALGVTGTPERLEIGEARRSLAPLA